MDAVVGVTRGGSLKKAHEYREHAEECRVLARTALSPNHKAWLEKMAETWEGLAKEREQRIARSKRIADLEQLSPNPIEKDRV